MQNIFDSEIKVMEIIWENEPVSAKEVSLIATERVGWNKNTTYTVLKKLSERGIFKTENSIVTSTMSKEEFYAIQSEQFVDETFKGSLPAFIAAFTKRKNLSEQEINEIKQMIDSFKGE